MTAPIVIRVFPKREYEARPRLFRALQAAFSVSFKPCEEIDPAGTEPLIALAGGRVDGIQSDCFFVREGERSGSDKAVIRLKDVPGARCDLSGLPMQEAALEEAVLSVAGGGCKIAAATEKGPVWIWKRTAAGRHQYEVAFGPKELQEREWLVDYVRPGRFLSLLPLIHFLRMVTNREGFEPMAPMAALVVDDPNLHQPSYGHIGFKDLIRHAEKHDYHAAIATVPLDSWRCHSGARSLFKENPKRISLLMHGNDHTSLELARPRSDERALQLFAQALRRVDGLEARSGLKVARVMEAPFGVCSVTSLRAMQKLDYRAMLLSPEVVLERLRDDDWPAGFGLSPLIPVCGGFPAIPRLRIVADWKTGAAINVCLGQPIVVATHHEDAMGEFELFGEAADLINGLGGMRWPNLDEMALSLYETRIEGRTLIARSYSRVVNVTVPEGIDEIALAPAWRGGMIEKTAKTGGARQVRLESAPNGLADHKQMAMPAFRPWAYVRRTLTAVRDRARPFVRGDRPATLQQA